MGEGVKFLATDDSFSSISVSVCASEATAVSPPGSDWLGFDLAQHGLLLHHVNLLLTLHFEKLSKVSCSFQFNWNTPSYKYFLFHEIAI